jgi:dihydroorotase (multifunctional complex type)
MSVDLVIRNSRVVTHERELVGGVAVQDGRIVAVGSDDSLPEGREVVDAGGKVLTPGAIDPHTHPGAYHPFGDDIVKQTRAAAAGGVTTMLGIVKVTRMSRQYKEITEPSDVVSYREVFPGAREMIDSDAHVDVGLTFAVQSDQHAEEIPLYAEEFGVSSYKFYLGYKNPSPWTCRIGLPSRWDDGTLYAAMENIARVGGCALFHSENQEVVRVLEARMKAQGRNDMAAWSERSPGYLESYHVKTVSHFAEVLGTTIYAVHINTSEGMAEVINQRHRGIRIAAECTPQHLLLTTNDEATLGNALVLHPPIRNVRDQTALWKGIYDNQVQVIGTDDVPGTRDELGKPLGEHECWKGKSGMVGVETMFPLLLSEGHHKRGIPLTRIVELCSYNAAKTFGLYPRKGTLEVGADADINLVDLDKRVTITAGRLHNYSDFTVFEGREVRGWPVATYLRGQLVASDGEPVGSASGRYVKRGPAILVA